MLILGQGTDDYILVMFWICTFPKQSTILCNTTVYISGRENYLDGGGLGSLGAFFYGHIM